MGFSLCNVRARRAQESKLSIPLAAQMGTGLVQGHRDCLGSVTVPGLPTPVSSADFFPPFSQALGQWLLLFSFPFFLKAHWQLLL